VPLGGSRNGSLHTYRNLMITMVLGGLWHGASWNFVVWGAMHGVALAATRMWQRRAGASAGKTSEPSRGFEILKGILTFHYVCLAWIFFRAEGFPRAAAMIKQIVRGPIHLTNLSRGVLVVILLGFVTHLLPKRLHDRMRETFIALPAPAQGGLLFVVALVLREVATTQVVPFVYFQF
jgi:alginate O-acetyltransferase complex protein AlgI